MKGPFAITLGLILYCSILSISEISGQPFQSAVGLRGGTSATGSYKAFVNERIAFEGIIGTLEFENFGTAVLVEMHSRADLGSLQWYWGLGPYLNFSSDYTALGVMGILGSEISLIDVPIQFSLDISPRVRLAGNKVKFFWLSAAIGMRYILKY